MEWLPAISIGLLSGFHCLGMCGPIAFALPLDRAVGLKKHLGIGLYQMGRLTTYMVLGVLFGVIGKSLFTAGLQRGVSIGLGVVMVLSAVLPGLFKGLRIESYTYRLLGGFQSAFKKMLSNHRLVSLFGVGVLNGLLPCAMVYWALAGAIISGTALGGASYMLAFGLGTLPLMLVASYASGRLKTSYAKSVKKWIPVFFFVLGAVLIVRGLNLNIPYLSPFINQVTPDISMCD